MRKKTDTSTDTALKVIEKIQSRKPGQTRSSSTRGRRKKKKDSQVLIAFLSILLLCLATGSYIFLSRGISVGAAALINNYDAAFITEKDSAYQKQYKIAYDNAEKNYHVSNRATISIGNLEEVQRLEVLKANDVEFITEDRDDNSGNVTAWLEVEGEGTFVINLQAAEFLVDNERRHVLARIPNPELANISIIKTTRRLFADDWKNGSYSEGVDLALKQRNEASLQIQKSLLSNQFVFDSACSAAESTLKNLIQQFNQDIPDITVDVEFIE